jgi:hypothetical protein
MSKAYAAAVAGCSMILALAACSRQADQPARAEVAGAASPASASASALAPTATSAGVERVKADGPTYTDGKPEWASNRNHSADENVAYQFGKHGAEFGAASADAYVAKVHAFVDHPPAGVQTATRERNGDRILYDAGSNTFAVVAKSGAPRTMFKPTTGKDYWPQAVAKLNDDSGYRSRSRSGGGRSSDDNG